MASPDHCQSVGSLIELARNAAASEADRHEAFGQLVSRFEDLAFACAYAALRDAALAEDAAQDAFLVAWERLGQLRTPEAFAGWIRKLVRTQCHRRLRSARLPLVPREAAIDVPTPTNPAVDVDSSHAATIVQLALAQLSAADRLVLILFYGSERSHSEIADWLRVPVTTVARRLAHAKRRLRRHALDAVSGELRAHRRIAGSAFAAELSARLRPAVADDDAEIAGLGNAVEAERARPIASCVPACAYVVEDPASQAPIAYAAAVPTIFAPIFELHLALGQDALRRHAGDVLVMQIVEDLVARRAITLQHRISARHMALVDFLVARGFEISDRAQDWRLAAPLLARAARRSTATRWEFRGLDALWTDPALFRAALALVTEAIWDDPAERAFLPIDSDRLRSRLHLQQDGVIAIADETLQGFIAGSMDDVVPNAVRINMVVVGKKRRREGLATAMLARLMETSGRGAARIVPKPSPAVAGWLTRCGFAQVADRLLLERLLRKAVQVAPERLNEYVGRYVFERLPMAPITIERHGNGLISKARDMRDLLLASSDCEFFTRHHYGHGRFERDNTGRVARLVYIEGSHEFVATRAR